MMGERAMMRIPRLLAIVALTGLVPAAGFAAEGNGLDEFRKLAGNWEGTNGKGERVRVSYEVVAGGTAVLEQFSAENHHNMVTMFHMNDGKLMLTHYCMVGNQPRMQAQSVTGRQIRFEFVDATGMESPETGHMHRAVFDFPSDNQMKASWTWREKGSDRFTEVVDLKRLPDRAAGPAGR